jgi:hypothetical protein
MTARLTRASEHDDQLGLTVTWNTAILDGRVESQALVHWSDQSYAPVRLTLRGTVTPVIALDPFAAVFFSVYQDEGGEGMVKIVNRDDRPLEITQLEPVGNHFTAQVRTLVPGQEYALVVNVPAGTEFGRFRERVVIHTNQPVRPEVPVAVNVFVKPDLYASPEVVDFGEVTSNNCGRSLRCVMNSRKSSGSGDAMVRSPLPRWTRIFQGLTSGYPHLGPPKLFAWISNSFPIR